MGDYRSGSSQIGALLFLDKALKFLNEALKSL